MNYFSALQHQSVALPEASPVGLRQDWGTREYLPRSMPSGEQREELAASGGTDIRPLIIRRVRSLSAELMDGARYVVDELISLLEEEEHDDQGILRPTLFAFRRSFQLVREAALQLREHFPRAAVSTDSEG